ncbi:ATP-binding protein [Kitasatospora aureofaciens]|uniref:sensor histidine kinase n=1 Tax=Kitasatospora aureofaciens TaxID=1894 RepID=UPI001C484030|nr:ATP-binding protein [Kitasatospora aureofaciens]MBV6697295.1 ATP-binding protein [Kitasatospora aureofaciens]
MPGISAPRTGHRAGRSGSLRSSLLALALVPSLGLAAAWGYAAYLLRDAGQRTALVAGTVVVALVLLYSLINGIRAARALSARLAGLRADTLALAQQEIPAVVGRLRSGEPVPVPPTWSPSRRAGDEVQQTADGLAAVRQAAVAAIVHQAQGREGTKKVFLNIARRTQILIHRQISMLDALEREHEEPDLLRELFAVDHLATRMRRNAENLVILGGALPARRWRNAVPVVNVLRSAVSETENYARVVVQGVPRASLSGQAVADVIHLVAELIENGTTFSPPYTQVQLSAQEVPKGLAVEVEDRGLGMTEEEYERLNDYLANPPELDVSALGDDLRLGLFVVARLAARHEIQVTLRPSPYGGTRAVVLVPAVLLEQAEQPAAVPGLPSGARVTRTPVPERRPGADGDLGDVDGELSGALAGVLSGLLGGGPAAGPEGAPAAGVPGAPEVPGASGASGAPGAFGEGDSGVIIGELLAQYPVAGDQDGVAPPANGGLPAGSPIPGLPGAVVVPRPALPRRYDDLAENLAESLGGADGTGDEGGAGGAAAAAAATANGAAGAGFDGTSADRSAPTHERAQEAPLDHDPDGGLRTPRVLPQRVRNASLAEQLREAHAPGAMLPPSAVSGPGPVPGPVPRPGGPAGPRHGTAEADDASPQRSRATMAAIQRGTRTARAADPEPDAPTAPPAPAAPSAAQEAKEQQ